MVLPADVMICIRTGPGSFREPVNAKTLIERAETKRGKFPGDAGKAWDAKVDEVVRFLKTIPEDHYFFQMSDVLEYTSRTLGYNNDPSGRMGNQTHTPAPLLNREVVPSPPNAPVGKSR